MTPCSPSSPGLCCEECPRRIELTRHQNDIRTTLCIDASSVAWPDGTCPVRTLEAGQAWLPRRVIQLERQAP